MIYGGLFSDNLIFCDLVIFSIKSNLLLIDAA